MVYQNHKSRFFRVRRCVPQGSVLGPVLFSLFINDLPVALPSSVTCSLYADDMAIRSSSPSVPTAVEATQGSLIRLELWSEYWCLLLNPSKCEVSFFSVDPHQANLLLPNSRLRFNPTSTFLGVTFHRTLSFSKHVSSLKAKSFPRLKALRCISTSSWSPLRSRSVLTTLSSLPSFLLPQSLWQIWQKLSLLSCSIRLQWIPGHSFLPGNDAADELTRRRALLVLSTIPCNFSLLISHIHSCLFSDWKGTVSSKFFDTQVPSISIEELVLPRRARCVLSLGLAESGILPAAPADTRPKIPLISFCTVQLRTLCATHSLATLCLFTTSGPDPRELSRF